MKKYVLLIIAVLFLTGFSTHRIFKSAKSGVGTAANNNIVTVSVGNISEVVTAVGNITPKQLIAVRTPISGTVLQIFHDYGDYVTQGETLLTLQPQPAPADYASAKQQVAEDLVAQQTALANLQRYEFLLKNNAISANDQDYANAKQTYETDKLTTELDQQKFDLLQPGKTTNINGVIANVVVAPISGYILQRNVDVGGAVTGESSAQTGDTLFTIADMNNLIFEGQVSEIDVAKIHKNMPALITVAALPNLKISGELTNIALQSVEAGASTTTSNNSNNSNNNTNNNPFNVGFDVWITNLKIPTNTKLLAGFSATANITIKTKTHVLLIPERALQFDNNKTFVLLFQGKKQQPIKKYITVGISDGINAEVVKGLTLGQQIVVTTDSGNTNNN